MAAAGPGMLSILNIEAKRSGTNSYAAAPVFFIIASVLHTASNFLNRLRGFTGRTRTKAGFIQGPRVLGPHQQTSRKTQLARRRKTSALLRG